jgi:hypothetical protein
VSERTTGGAGWSRGYDDRFAARAGGHGQGDHHPAVGAELSGFVARTTPMPGIHDDRRAHGLAGAALVEAALVLLAD